MQPRPQYARLKGSRQGAWTDREKMNTYEILPFSQANSTERALLIAVEAAAREIASTKISSQRTNYGQTLEIEAALALDLSGVRPAFLDNQMHLNASAAERNYRAIAYARMTKEAASAIYGLALANAEELASA